MAPTQQHAAESQPPAPSGDAPRRRPGDSVVETPGPPGSGPAGGALFRAMLTAGVEPAAAYTAVREMESMAGQSVVTQLGAQIQALATTLERLENRLEDRLANVEDRLANVENRLANLETLKTDVAVLKREVRLIWAALFLAVPTLTAVLVRFFGS